MIITVSSARLKGAPRGVPECLSDDWNDNNSSPELLPVSDKESAELWGAGAISAKVVMFGGFQGGFS